MISFYRVAGVLLGRVGCGRDEFVEHLQVRAGDEFLTDVKPEDIP
jgi:hypothetical protein